MKTLTNQPDVVALKAEFRKLDEIKESLKSLPHRNGQQQDTLSEIMQRQAAIGKLIFKLNQP